jgi:hypothetical protein
MFCERANLNYDVILVSTKDEGPALRSAVKTGGLLVAKAEPEPVDLIRDCLLEAYGAAAPEFVSAFKAALRRRDMVIIHTGKVVAQ